jgi:uncharacterized protein YjeT (DUF2065 family)
MTDFLVALGLLAVLEGMLYAVAPGSMKRALKQILDTPDQTIRYIGLVAMGIGVAIVWLVRG